MREKFGTQGGVCKAVDSSYKREHGLAGSITEPAGQKAKEWV